MVERKQEQQREYIDKKRSAFSIVFKAGYWVRVKRPKRWHKLRPQLSAPIQVRGRIAKYSYVLQDGSRWHVSALVASRLTWGSKTGGEALDPVRQPVERDDRDQLEGSEETKEVQDPGLPRR